MTKLETFTTFKSLLIYLPDIEKQLMRQSQDLHWCWWFCESAGEMQALIRRRISWRRSRRGWATIAGGFLPLITYQESAIYTFQLELFVISFVEGFQPQFQCDIIRKKWVCLTVSARNLWVERIWIYVSLAWRLFSLWASWPLSRFCNEQFSDPKLRTEHKG